jgi:hypothetical protein
MITVIFIYQDCGFKRYIHPNNKPKSFKNEEALFQYIDNYNTNPIMIPNSSKRIIDFKIV